MKHFEKINTGLIITSLLLVLYYLITYFIKLNIPMILFSIFLITLFLSVYYIDFKKIYLSIYDKTITLSFLLLAGVLGSLTNLYKYVSFYDNLMHFISGFLVTYLAFIMLDKNKIKKSWFYFLLAFSFGALITGFWEILEYLTDLSFKTDTQKVALFGIHDTMVDIIYGYLGSALLIALYTSGITRKIKKK